MKRTLTLFAAIVLLVIGATAQKLSYQAVVRNDANELVTETTLQVAVMVLNANNAVQYAETHANVQTNRNGLLSLMIGDGISMSSNTLADVEWPGASLRTVITLPDNTTITNVTPVNSVPYALYADNVDPDMVSNAIAEYIASHSIGGEDNVQADWNESNQSSDAFIRNKPVIPNIPTNVSYFTNDVGYLTDFTFTESDPIFNAWDKDYNDLINKPIIPTNLSYFTNDMGYLTEAQCNGVDICSLLNMMAALQHRLDSLQTIVDTMNGIFVCGVSTVNDHEGNVYNTVQIGDQCWTKENLRTTTSPSTRTYLIPAANEGESLTGKQARWYNNDSATYAPMNYGLLYNWNAAVDTFNTAYGETSVIGGNAVSVRFTGYRRGICPVGWHLPSDVEWTTLTNYVGGVSEYQCGGSSSNIAKALASETWWAADTNDCTVGYDPTINNSTGFSAVPAGHCALSSFYGVGTHVGFWSSTEWSSNGAYSRGLYFSKAGVDRDYNTDKRFSRSVRCLRD